MSLIKIRWVRLVGLAVMLVLVAAACSPAEDIADTTEPVSPATTAGATEGADAPTTTSNGEEDETLRIAFFASSSQNAYNQAIWEGVQQAAAEAGNVEVEIFDGEFNAELQFNQIEDIVASGRFDGFVVVPNDTVGIAPAIVEAIAEGIVVASALFPIGPDLTSLEPQIEGIITASQRVNEQAAEGAELVAQYCENLDPCRVIIIMGQLQFPFDNVRYEAFLSVLEREPNIEILATGEGGYSRDLSLTVMQDLIQAHGEFDVLLSNADQHVAGAVIALEEAGFDIPSMYIMGGGASAEAIEAIIAGEWDATLTNYPWSEGFLSATEVIKALRGQPFEQVIDMATQGQIPGYVITAEDLQANPDFVPEWSG